MTRSGWMTSHSGKFPGDHVAGNEANNFPSMNSIGWQSISPIPLPQQVQQISVKNCQGQ